MGRESLVWSDLTLGYFFKVKRGKPNLKARITRLLLDIEVWDGKPTYRKQGHCRSMYLPPGISKNGELNEIRAL